MFKRNQIHFSYFPFRLPIAPLLKCLKCIGHGSHYEGIGKCKLRPAHRLSVNTPCNFLLTEHPFLWKGFSSATDFPQLTFLTFTVISCQQAVKSATR